MALSLVALALLAGAFFAGTLYGTLFGVPFVDRYQDWSIGIWTGESPLSLEPVPGESNPVLRACDVTDRNTLFVADPFLLSAGNGYAMFFEVYSRDDRQGDIAVATSRDGLSWTYGSVVLDEPFHLSYPYVFRWAGETFMVPESVEALGVFLYRATAFPLEWVRMRMLLEGRYVDPSLIHYAGRWWLFVGEETNDILRLFSAESLDGPFAEHPESPLVVGDASRARPGGRLLEFDGRLFRCAQDDADDYGKRIVLYEILTLTVEAYEEAPTGIEWTGGTSGWDAAGVHHLDALERNSGGWLAVVDGWSRRRLVFTWR